MKKQRQEAKNSQAGDTKSSLQRGSGANQQNADFGRNSNFSFISNSLSNNLKDKAKTIKERQQEYVLENVPKPKQRKQWKQDISHL